MLTLKREAFCMCYVKLGGNATQAYKDAGYRVKNDNSAAASASALLRNPEVKLRIDEIRQELHNKQIAEIADRTAAIKSKNIMDIAEMQERLSEIARQEATELVYTSNGSIQERTVSTKDALKAMELLGKMQGAFLDRQQVEMSGAVPVVIKDDVSE